MSSPEDFQRELINDFIIESIESLDSFDRELLDIEKGEGGEGALNNLFRVIHTIKGTAGCLGLSRIEKAGHKGEDLMSLLRDGLVKVTPERVSVLLRLSDTLRRMLGILEQDGLEGDEDTSTLLAELKRLASTDLETASESTVEVEEGFGFFEDDEVLVSEDPSFGLFDDDETSVDTKASQAVVAKAKPADTEGRRSVTDNAIRVDVTHLDKVMNIVGELVLARNQILLNTVQFDQAALLTASQRLNIITTELQENVMKTRMQPIKKIWANFPRIVRDLSNELGKKVKLIMDGQDTDLDRTIIEAIKDPLTHIVRNSIDHGIESPEVRLACDKPEEGFISLRAFHEGGQVNIEIMDDGAGVDPEIVKAKAVAKNLLTAAEADRMGERELIKLIFLPGFSTATKISNVSGRGVGMDVVKTNIEKIGGSVDLQTELGQGSTIRIKIPLTLAIIPALVVTSGGDRYAIPQVSLLELVRFDREHSADKIELLYGAPVYRLRGRLLPIVYLNEQLKIESEGSSESMNVVVLQADGRQFGLVVDEINDTEEIVVKPLGKHLKNISCFAGATIMGDGKVALILDALGLAQHADVVTDCKEVGKGSKESTDKASTSEKLTSMLIFEAGSGRRLSIPLSTAARLEEFSRDRVEMAGSSQVIQYRGQILPLIEVAKYLPNVDCPVSAIEQEDLLQVIVYTDYGRSVGLIVDRVDDIVEAELELQYSAVVTGILGSIVIQERVTDVLDIEGIIKLALPSLARDTSEILENEGSNYEF